MDHQKVLVLGVKIYSLLLAVQKMVLFLHGLLQMQHFVHIVLNLVILVLLGLFKTIIWIISRLIQVVNAQTVKYWIGQQIPLVNSISTIFQTLVMFEEGFDILYLHRLFYECICQCNHLF